MSNNLLLLPKILKLIEDMVDDSTPLIYVYIEYKVAYSYTVITLLEDMLLHKQLYMSVCLSVWGMDSRID